MHYNSFMTDETAPHDLPGDGHLVVSRRIRIPLSEFEWTFSRSSGPGGQNVNKVSSKAQLRWNVSDTESLPADVKERFVQKYRRRITTSGEFLISSQRYRDQPNNVDDCRRKLCELILAVSVAPKTRKKTKPGRAAKERRLREKKRRSERKQMRKQPRGEE
ncbi:MAG: alternative ribosome rescue aminoacyl-tRNA hydrolase ArfB [Planctomycetaceae bacterium]